MHQLRTTATALSVILVVAALTSGCAPAQQPASPVTAGEFPAPTATSAAPSLPAPSLPAPSLPGPSTVSGNPVRQRGSDHGSRPAAAGVPADWPKDLPVPAGSITGSTGSAGRWTVLIVAAGSADQVRRSAVALYSAAGFTPVTDSVLNKGTRQITVVVENRDHSATSTNLIIGVTTG